MSAEMKLPVEFFGEFDLHGKPLKAISMVYLDIRERLAQFLLSVDPVNFTSEPEIIIEDVDTGLGGTEKVASIHISVRASFLNKLLLWSENKVAEMQSQFALFCLLMKQR